MTDMTPARLAELKAVAEAATHGSRAAKGSLITTAGGSTLGQALGINWRHDLRFMAEVSPETVLSLIAALEAKTYEAERLREMGQGLIKQRDEARAEVEALDREVWRMRALRTEASADRTLEMVEQQRDKADRRADRAEAAIERAREAATEVANQGDNLGRTHYEKCWTQHLHCLAAKINFEAVVDDATQP